jgi:hypothetical protein
MDDGMLTRCTLLTQANAEATVEAEAAAASATAIHLATSWVCIQGQPPLSKLQMPMLHAPSRDCMTMNCHVSCTSCR